MFNKKIVSIIIITVLFLGCLLNSKAFASSMNIVTIQASNTAELTDTSGAGTITITSANNTAGTTNTAVTENKVNNLTSIASNNTTAISSYNNTATNSSTNTNTNRTGLPYTGSNSSIGFFVIALIVSALYAYKKIRDYNI